MNERDLRSYNVLKRYKVIGLVNKVLVVKDSGFKGLMNKSKEKKDLKKYKLKSGEVLTNEAKLKLEVGSIDVVLENSNMYEDVNKELKDEKVTYYYLNGTQKSKLNKLNSFDFPRLFVNRAFIYVTNKKVNVSDFYYCINVNYKNLDKIKEILNSNEGLKLYGNYNTTNNITVKASTFFNDIGTNYYSGGAERYLIDLHEVCNEMGFNLDIYQNGSKPYFRKYNNINVIGLKPIGIKNAFNYEFMDRQTKNYIYETKFKSNLHIYSAFQECYPNHIGPSIGISHGISWDSKCNNYQNGIEFWNSNKWFIDSAHMCDKLVSVDTNTANWFQTINFDIGNRKFHVIPNYVDTKEFSPRKDYLEKRDKIVITYPRRLYEARGLYITLDVVDDILDKYDNVEFHFVGKGFQDDLDKVEEKVKKYNGRVKCYSKSPYEMHEVYKMSDISLIPTQYSEGTSLSCLEAMASGNIVVATRIGGLTDLILNEYNGYLIEPDKDSLRVTLEKILDNFESHKEMKKNAIKVAEKFNKNTWKDKWKQVISSMNLKGNSKTNELVEFYLEDVKSLDDKVYDLVKKELIDGNLVYLKFKNALKNDNLTGNLLQVVPYDEEVVSKAVRVYSDKKLNIKDSIVL